MQINRYIRIYYFADKPLKESVNSICNILRLRKKKNSKIHKSKECIFLSAMKH
jgi:hypothetical protein